MNKHSKFGANGTNAEIVPTTYRQIWARFIGRVAYLSETETKVSTRGFLVRQPEVVERLESIGKHFTFGYNQAIKCVALAELGNALALQPVANSGFAYEGAAMGLVISDWLTPRRQFFNAYIKEIGRHHEYMAWVGLGWAIARVPVISIKSLAAHRSLNKWLALDGYGFHEGYFNWKRSILKWHRPRGLNGDFGRVFDQGLGRSLWFVRGAEPIAVVQAIRSFDKSRHSDLWAGVGLAATYAGGASTNALNVLRECAGPNYASLAQGAVFAAEARRRAKNPIPDAESACHTLLGMSLTSAADIALETIPPGHSDSLSTYQQWRLNIQQRCQTFRTV